MRRYIAIGLSVGAIMTGAASAAAVALFAPSAFADEVPTVKARMLTGTATAGTYLCLDYPPDRYYCVRI
jgi:hypothetical protein